MALPGVTHILHMNDYTIDEIKVRARNYRTAVRRVRGYQRGELDINGKTILASKRKPPGRSMRKRKKNEPNKS